MIQLSVHGAAGALDLVVPAGATSVDVARAYAEQAEVPGIPLLQTSLGELLTADKALADAGVVSGTVLVATAGVHRGRATGAEGARGSRAGPESPALAGLVTSLAAVTAMLSAWYAARAGDQQLRTVAVGVLMACALLAALPTGRHLRQRNAAAPAFGAAAAFAAVYEPGAHLVPSILAVSALVAAAVAAVARTMAPTRDETMTVWIVAGIVVFVVCGASPLMEWDPRVSWALLLVLAFLAARFVPSLAIDVPDEALLDLDRLAVTAWSARDRATGRRGRMVVREESMAHLVSGASRTVSAAAAAVFVVASVAAPLLLSSAVIDLDRIGARCLTFFAGGSLLLAARSYRHSSARALLRAAGLVCWLSLLVFVVADLSGPWGTTVVVVALLLGAAVLAAAVATGRGWRSIWWARRAEVAESFCGSFAIAAAVVASGAFRQLWEITS